MMKASLNLFIVTNHLKITVSLCNRFMALKSYAGHFLSYVFHKIELNFCFCFLLFYLTLTIDQKL